MASLTGLNCLLLAASGLVLLLGASSGEHRWNPEHRALWAANVQGRGGRPASPRGTWRPGRRGRRRAAPGCRAPRCRCTTTPRTAGRCFRATCPPTTRCSTWRARTRR
ncbi:uncharacterized protein LOC117639451 [Thrips palmi]|uniref:Uncharacterized protein LOC117639451 n=1 Tax=Thrips palmi TaxID=161013 RepID=A0A6P8XVK4_THRPL|nr:uncharacterized protein LOC117639451 [Thrips palmi]